MKIAMISSNPHDRIGGTETYARNLIRAFSNEHEITEYPIMFSGKKVTSLDANVKVSQELKGLGPDDLIWAKTYKKKVLKQIYNNNDVVILNNVFPPKKFLSDKKTILVQHMDTEFYGFKGKPFWLGIGSFFSWALFGVSGTIGNPFKRASNVVFFDETTACKTESNKFFIPLPSKENQLKLKRSGIAWISRLDNPQKNVDDAIFLANNIKSFNIYGDGPYKNKMINMLESKKSYKGLISADEVKRVMASSKAIALTSNWEGFPFTIVEALHAGTPVVLYDTFKAVEFFKGSGLVHIAKNKEDMLNILEGELKSGNKIFARKKLSQSAFKANWEKVLKEVSNE